jgi:hypothetical protein
MRAGVRILGHSHGAAVDRESRSYIDDGSKIGTIIVCVQFERNNKGAKHQVV